MDFLKRHYEKIVLGVVLLGLVVAVALLYFKIENEKRGLAEQAEINRPNPQELAEVNLSRGESTLKRLENKITLELAPPHNVVSPVQWVRTSDGKVVKQEAGGGSGPSAVKVVKIDPLHLILSYEGTNVGGYVIAITREAAPRPSGRSRTTRTVNVNDRPDSTTLFTLKGIKGPTNAPTELTLVMADSGNTVTLTPPNIFREVAGYKATLRYPPDNNREFRDQYRDSEISLDGDRYIVLPISDTEVVLSAKPNGKKTTVRLESGSPSQ